jgi:hypothetical protein
MPHTGPCSTSPIRCRAIGRPDLPCVTAQRVDDDQISLPLYRPRFLRHLVRGYAALAAGGSCSVRMAAGSRKPCRSMSQVVL